MTGTEMTKADKSGQESSIWSSLISDGLQHEQYSTGVITPSTIWKKGDHSKFFTKEIIGLLGKLIDKSPC